MKWIQKHKVTTMWARRKKMTSCPIQLFSSSTWLSKMEKWQNNDMSFLLSKVERTLRQIILIVHWGLSGHYKQSKSLPTSYPSVTITKVVVKETKVFHDLIIRARIPAQTPNSDHSFLPKIKLYDSPKSDI